MYAQFADLYGQEIDFRRDGYLYLLSDHDSVEAFTQQVELHNHHGVPSAIVEPDEAKRISPLIRTDDLLAACWSPRDGKASPSPSSWGTPPPHAGTERASCATARSSTSPNNTQPSAAS